MRLAIWMAKAYSQYYINNEKNGYQPFFLQLPASFIFSRNYFIHNSISLGFFCRHKMVSICIFSISFRLLPLCLAKILFNLSLTLIICRAEISISTAWPSTAHNLVNHNFAIWQRKSSTLLPPASKLRPLKPLYPHK